MPLVVDEKVAIRKDFSKGIAIRSVAITSACYGQVSMALEDLGHAFTIDLTYNKQCITGVSATWLRHPFSSCVGAADYLNHFIGCPLSDDLSAVLKFADAKQHCTHMFDVVSLAIVHAHQQRSDCRYDLLMPDTDNGNVSAQLKRNGVELMVLQLENYDNITSPMPFAGRSLYKGFLKWAKSTLSTEQYEYCFLIQKAMFVARLQKLDILPFVGGPAPAMGPTSGSCFGSQQPAYDNATRIGSGKYFTAKPEEQVLQFFDTNGI